VQSCVQHSHLLLASFSSTFFLTFEISKMPAFSL